MPAPTALITGGTSGIGKATAEALHYRGYRVAVTGRNPESLARVREELPDEVLVLEADSRSLEATERVVAEIRDRFGSLNTLFLNAGVMVSMSLDAWDEESFDNVFSINAKGQFFTLAKTLPLLVDGASVVFTVGIGAKRGIAGASVAAGSRGALLAMMPSLAVELAPRRIRVNTVSPGAIETPLWTKSSPAPDTVPGLLAGVAARIPFGRVGGPEDITEAVAFLASDEAAYITGQEIVIAGGMGLSTF
jgi:NAD(P)-dependent dehydrogenase (short-subunit alcohol dehydrogenase family)